MTTQLATVGVMSAALTIPAAAYAQSPGEASEPPTGEAPVQHVTVEDRRPTTEELQSMTFISGQEADRLGISGTLPETRPELPDGVVPPEYRSSKALAAATATCRSGKQCMWTGGYFTGPGRHLDGGHEGTYWGWTEAKCTGSGNPSGNRKNCASSLRNDNTTFGFTVFNNSDSAPVGSYKSVPANDQREQLGSFDNNIERSVGFG